MKILVTGGAGFIGSAVVRQAIRDGHQVVNLDVLTYAACLDNVASVAEVPGYAFEQVDIRDRPALDTVFARHKPDTVMHWPLNPMWIGPLMDRVILSKPTSPAPIICLRPRAPIGWPRASPQISGSTTFPQTKCLDRCPMIPAFSLPKPPPMTHVAPILRPRPPATIWCALGPKPTGCQW